jgi:hypothetical protein
MSICTNRPQYRFFARNFALLSFVAALTAFILPAYSAPPKSGAAKASAALSPFAPRAVFDEGMWTFDNLPLATLKEKFGFVPTQEWLDNVRLSSVRFNDGGSGSFVSPNGLVMTNHHVAAGQLGKLSTKERDLLATGYYADKPEKELKCADLELNVLVSMENVSERVNAAAKSAANPADAQRARGAAIQEIERESLEKTGLRSDVVDLYRGGEYWLYRYKKYTDVRLVFAPEKQIAYFGGDPDNFTYPRYDLDCTFFRVYENGKPVKPERFLKWNNAGPQENELVFVSGHPGSTNRLNTFAQFEFNRDYFYPARLQRFAKILEILREFAAKSDEHRRRAQNLTFSISNAQKASTGEYEGLQNPRIAELCQKNEEALRAAVAKMESEAQTQFADAWSIVENTIAAEKTMLGNPIASSITGLIAQASYAQSFTRFAAEMAKPDSLRADGFKESQLEDLKFRLLSPAPVYPDLEEALFLGMLKYAIQELGSTHAVVSTILCGRSPEIAAREIFANTKLYDLEYRAKLFEGRDKAVSNAPDSIFALMKRLAPALGAINRPFGQQVAAPRAEALKKIAQARFAVYGKNQYPDATFTLRLSYGTVKGYGMNGTIAPWKTTLYGLFDRASSFDNKGDFMLPKRFWDRKAKLDLSTPANYVTTCDIIGGNSGSPIVNAKGELVGLIFDGNIESLPNRFVYNDLAARSVAVHPAFMIEALRKVYDAEKLAKEIMGK